MAQTPTGGNNGEFSTMGESLTKQCPVEVQGPQVVNSFFQKKTMMISEE